MFYLSGKADISSPPLIPDTDSQLERAICLLGNRGKANLSKKAQQELIELLGAYPDQDTARCWKATLRQIARSKITS